MSAGAIVVAAGASTRMGSAGDKTLADIGGEPLIARTIDVFERCDAVTAVALVVSERNMDAIAALRDAKSWRKTIPPRVGGARRQDSVRAGLSALPTDCDWVLVHDGARPFVTSQMIEDGLAAAAATGAAIAAIPAFDTVKRVASDGRVVETLDRSELAMVQTPQVFRRAVLERAHAEVTDDVTDDAAMVERIGVEVRTFEGARSNVKVTMPEDLGIALGLLLEEARNRIDQRIEVMEDESVINTLESQILANIHHDDARHLVLAERALAWVGHRFGAISRFDQDNQLVASLYLLNAMTFNSLRAAILVLKRGYYAQAIGLTRAAMETNFYAQHIEEYPEPLNLLLGDEIGTGPMTLNNMKPRSNPENKGWWDRYGNLSEMGVHLRSDALRLIYRGDSIIVGGYNDSYFLLGTLYDMLPEITKLMGTMEKFGKITKLNWQTDAARVILDIKALREEIFDRLPDGQEEM